MVCGVLRVSHISSNPAISLVCATFLLCLSSLCIIKLSKALETTEGKIQDQKHTWICFLYARMAISHPLRQDVDQSILLHTVPLFIHVPFEFTPNLSFAITARTFSQFLSSSFESVPSIIYLLSIYLSRTGPD